MNIKLIFLLQLSNIKITLKNNSGNTDVLKTTQLPLIQFISNENRLNIIIPARFLKNSLSIVTLTKMSRLKTQINSFFYISRFVVNFLEFFFKSSVIFNLKKGTNKLVLKQISFRKFSIKYFKKNLKVTKHILGVLYYSLLLKDASIFANFFRKILEKANLKLHKKLLLGVRKLIKDFFKPIFLFLGVEGVLLNIKGKIGVSGSAKKRRYFFYFGKHSITTRSLKMDIKFLPVWTFTGTLGLTFLIFF